MHKQDAEWLNKCINDPEKYKVYVDNDDIFIVEISKEDPNSFDSETIYSFTNFGYDFIVDVLDYLGVNVDYV